MIYTPGRTSGPSYLGKYRLYGASLSLFKECLLGAYVLQAPCIFLDLY